MALKIGINGYGRIGRTLFRVLAESKDMQIVGINDLAPANTLAYLTKYDTVMGKFEGNVSCDGSTMKAGVHNIAMLQHKEPEQIPWGKLGVDVVIEATGKFVDRAGCSKHLKAGAKRVLLSAPSKDDVDLTVVYGVNHHLIKPEHQILSNASCTTNCLAPIVKVLHENFGIKSGLMSTVHAYTNDQRLGDLAHKDLPRSRSANENIIPTTTGAAKTVAKVIPEMKGRLDGIALRVPVPDGSIVDLVATLEKSTTREALNAAVKEAARGPLKGVIEYSEDPIVSSDIIGNPHSSIFDSQSTQVIGGNFVKILSWYDNEWGFTCRLADVLRLMA